MKILLIIICLLTMTGCTGGDRVEGEQYMAVSGQEEQGTAASADDNTAYSFDDLYADSDFEGTVASYDEEGCIVIPTKTETTDDGTEIAYSATPGSGNDTDRVTVSYQKDCLVQIAVIQVKSEEIKLIEASIEDIKEQSSVFIQGEFKDTYHLSASKIIILKFE